MIEFDHLAVASGLKVFSYEADVSGNTSDNPLMAFLKKTIGNYNVQMWYRCIILTIDFCNKTNFQLFSLFFLKTSDFFFKSAT